MRRNCAVQISLGPTKQVVAMAAGRFGPVWSCFTTPTVLVAVLMLVAVAAHDLDISVAVKDCAGK